ncbi:MAG: ATP-binding protein [Dokdonella sp.]
MANIFYSEIPSHQRWAVHGPRQIVQTLAGLRFVAVVGQLLTIIVVHYGMRMALPLGALLAGIAALAIFDLLAFWRLASPRPISAFEALLHIGVDTLMMGYLLYLTGGATNPFVSLLVMPITLAAAALRLRDVVAVAALAAMTYLAVMRWYLPLPSLGPDSALTDFNLHIIGMAISFVITAATLGFFIARLAASLRARQAEAELERERALRDEGILAIATQAAGTAHELNTPLSTIRTLLTEMRREQSAHTPLGEDLALLAEQAERCRSILRELVAVGRTQLADVAETMTVGNFVTQCASTISLLRPDVVLRHDVEEALADRLCAVVPALRHAVINLLNNAADATLSAGDDQIELAATENDGAIEFRIRDHGSGSFTEQKGRFRSSKSDGLGLGLALANATAERLGGDLIAHSPSDGGTLQCLRIPNASLEPARHA